MPKIIDEEQEQIIESPLITQPLGQEYEPEELQELAQTDFGSVPMQGGSWMTSLKRMRNVIEDAKNSIQRMRRAQTDLPTANDLIANPRLTLHQPVYEMERRWQLCLGSIQNLDSTLESLRQEIDTVDRELRMMSTVKKVEVVHTEGKRARR